jgi:dGTPase
MAKHSRRPDRERRRFSENNCDGGRTVPQRDRDRILYTTALRRLAGVTQVVAPNEGHVVHNRLTHVLEVAQIARRLTERLIRESSARDLASIGGLNEDVAEAAALAHDLGHPPFGHVAEAELDELVRQQNVADGFEGNAQSFRIVTKLATRKAKEVGLDLSRATLAAILKYPWLRDSNQDSERHEKFGAYFSEEEDLRFARKGHPVEDRQSAEARIMDLADDIAYSLSDVEDSVRSGRIPFTRLKTNEEEREKFTTAAILGIKKLGPLTRAEVGQALGRLLKIIPTDGDWNSRRVERAALKQMSAVLMGDYIKSATVNPNPKPGEQYIAIPREDLLEIALLKHLTWHYVINHPALALQQEAEKKIICGLFAKFLEPIRAPDKSDARFFPERLKEQLETGLAGAKATTVFSKKVRCIADFIAGMSDDQAVELYHRISGFSVSRSLAGMRI